MTTRGDCSWLLDMERPEDLAYLEAVVDQAPRLMARRDMPDSLTDWWRDVVKTLIATCRRAQVHNPLTCYDCGLLYSGPAWCDVVLSDEDWPSISPTGDLGGVLCFNCIARRLTVAGREGVPMQVTSGPFARTNNGGRRDWRTADLDLEPLPPNDPPDRASLGGES